MPSPKRRRRASSQPAPDVADTLDPLQPEVAWPSAAYKLTAEQEKRLTEHAFMRLDQLEESTGRREVKDENWFRGSATKAFSAAVAESAATWMGKRMAYTMIYENEADWRAYAIGNIFADSNWLVPISRRVVSQQTARANAYLFGTEPWLAIDQQGIADQQLALDSDRWVKHKFKEAWVKSQLEAAVCSAFVRGESVVKHVHSVREDLYEAAMICLVDNDQTGGEPQPKLAKDGEVITPDDRWIPDPLNPGSGREVLARDGVTPKPAPEFTRWMEMIIPRRIPHYKGPSVGEVYFKDILIPLEAPDVQAADAVIHLYDEAVSTLIDRYARTGQVTESGGNPLEDQQRAVAAFMKLANNHGAGTDAYGVGAATDYRAERPEDVAARHHSTNRARASGPEHRPVAKIAECWLRFDANQDGIEENILFVVDRETRQPLFYDYVGNVTPTGLRPFTVVRINPVQGRWYGVGSMQIYEQIQAIVDLTMNRWNLEHSRKGRVDLFRPYNTVEGQSNPDLQLNWGGAYTPLEGKTAKDIIESVYLDSNRDQDLQGMLEFWLQLAMNMSGVSHANDLAMAGSDSIKTATGTLNVEKMGYEQFGQMLSDLEKGVAGVANAAAELALVNMDPEESFAFFEGQVAAFGVIKRDDLSTVRLNIRLTLTRQRAEQQMASGEKAIELAKGFYIELPPAVQQKLAPLYRQVMRALQIQDADTLIQPMDPMALGMGQPGMGPAMAAGAAPFDPAMAGGMATIATPFGPAAQMNPTGQAPKPPIDQFEGQMAGGQRGGLASQAAA